MLMKFDSNFDTIFKKSYFMDTLWATAYGSGISNDSNYLLIGASMRDNNFNETSKARITLIKTDTLGNLIWRKTYGSSSYINYGYKVVNTYEGGYLLGGWSDKNGGDWCIVKTDENGENPIYKYYGSQWADGRIAGISLTSDSCYLVYGAKSITEDTQKARIIKLNKNLVVQWDKLYDFESQATAFNSIIEKSDANFLGLVSYYTQIVGGLYKTAIYNLDPNGNIIFRQSTAAGDTLETMSIPCDIKLTNDSGYIFTGWATNSAQWTPTQQMWLVKTNQYGYDGTEWTLDTVFTGIEEIAEIASKNQSGLLVYPNPATNNLQLVISNEQYNKNDVFVSDNNSKAVKFPLGEGGLRGIDNPLTKEQFQNLPINQKLKYNIAHPEQKFWGKAEKQELKEIANKLCYSLPYAALNGEVNIFSIEPVFAMQVESNINVIARNEERMTKQSVQNNNEITSSYSPRNDVDVVIYDIYGRIVYTSTTYSPLAKGARGIDPITINISNLKKGIYFIKIVNQTAKFIKE